MPKSKARKNVDENFKVAAVQRLQTGGVPANDLAKELGVSIWSLRRWSRQYRKRTAAGEGVAGEPATFATASQELPAKNLSENAQASLRTIRWIIAILIQASLVRGLIS
jgi:transposase-like protein